MLLEERAHQLASLLQLASGGGIGHGAGAGRLGRAQRGPHRRTELGAAAAGAQQAGGGRVRRLEQVQGEVGAEEARVRELVAGGGGGGGGRRSVVDGRGGARRVQLGRGRAGRIGRLLEGRRRRRTRRGQVRIEERQALELGHEVDALQNPAAREDT